MKNAEIALLFEKTADVLAVKGENSFKILAFRKVARAGLEEMATDVEVLAREEAAPGAERIGEGSAAQRIEEFLRTGKIAEFIDLWNEVPAGVMEMMRHSGHGAQDGGALVEGGGHQDDGRIEGQAGGGRMPRQGLDTLAGMGAKKLEKIKLSMAHLAHIVSGADADRRIGSLCRLPRRWWTF